MRIGWFGYSVDQSTYTELYYLMYNLDFLVTSLVTYTSLLENRYFVSIEQCVIKMRIDMFTAVVFWFLTTCNFLDGYQCSGVKIYCLHVEVIDYIAFHSSPSNSIYYHFIDHGFSQFLPSGIKLFLDFIHFVLSK